MLFNNKKASEKLLSIWWFFVLGVIGGGIVLGVFIYYSADTAVKSVEADILINNLINCVSHEGYFNDNVLNETFNFFNECNLNKRMFSIGSFYYFNVSIYDKDYLVYNKTGGDYSLEADCRVAMKIKNADKYPGCSEISYPLSYGNKTLRLVVLAGSNQIGGKVPIK
jgi:hypothetical protein